VKIVSANYFIIMMLMQLPGIMAVVIFFQILVCRMYRKAV